ncbi:MAG TPA: cytochrome ubiquinol oxidase subunit I [Aquifex aeolicus]|nr:cytochrome ubiquinol oxidase subunit I [Aquifex aeolicus]
MDAILLARIQFGLTAMYHFLFVPITLGLSFLLAIIWTKWAKEEDSKKKLLYENMGKFWTTLFAINFAAGVVTGIVMEFEFGTAWSEYSKMVGDIFGAPLAIEAIFAFFLESVFLGVLLFGRDRISPKFYAFSAWMVALGSNLSALWILVANSWQQTPKGFYIENGVARLEDFFGAVINYSTLFRFAHMLLAGAITGTIFVAGISAYYLLKRKHVDVAKESLKIAVTVGMIASLLQIIVGDLHGYQVAKTQPLKLAIMEGKWETEPGAGLEIIPGIEIPKLLSILAYHDPDAKIYGIKDLIKVYQRIAKGEEVKDEELPELWLDPRQFSGRMSLYITEEDIPPVWIPYLSLRVMVFLGFFFALITTLGFFYTLRNSLEERKFLLKLLVFSIPLPIITNILGWAVAEVGRQPWVVYYILQTKHAVSPLPPAQILTSIILFTVIYSFVFLLFAGLTVFKVKKGPESLPQEVV